MKKIFTLLIVMMFSVAALFAQTPEKFSYQAVVRNSNNTLVSNAPVGVRVSILSGGASGNIVYSETHTTATNANGLLTIEIGSGSVQQGAFSDIAWGEGMLFLKTEIDPTGGSNYSITSVQQLLSVPYALYAKEAANGFSGDYNDLENKPQIPTVPTNVSAFTNDAGYLTSYTETDPQFNAWDKDYNDLINKPTIPTVPDSVSAFVNDAGYLTSYTEQQVLSISNDTIFLTGGSFVKLPTAEVGFSGDYNDLINKPQIPTVPTNVSAFSNDAGYLTSFTEQQILSISNDTIFLTGGSFVKLPAGFDGDYNSLTNKPVIPTVPTSLSAFVNDMGYITAIPDSLGGISMESDPIFSAWDKDYNDLINTPEIPTVPTNVSSFSNDAGYVTANQLSNANYITAEDIPAQVNADWNATEGAAQILNKPSLFSGNYNDLANKPQIPTVPTNVSAFSNDAGYITMDSIPDMPTVPTNLSAFVNDVGYITAIPDSLGGISIESDPIFSAWDKDYNDLINTPEIPIVPTNVGAFTNDAGYVTASQLSSANYITAEDILAQVNADWNATEGAAQILNKPTLFSGDYNDLINTPEIPTVPANVSAFTNDAGYLTSFTEQQILSISNDTIFLTGGSFVKLPAGFDGDYNSLTNKPAIPTIPDSVSAFVNDAGYITNADLPEIPTIPTNVSAFNNDAGYITNNNSDCLNSVDLCDLQNRIDELDSLVNLFNELPSTPTVLTTGVTAITTTSFTVTGEVVLEGGSNVTERGFVYGLTNNPTISDSKTTNGGRLGSFTATIPGLQAGYTYYVRAYATNQNGTAYGSQMTVTTNTISPSTLPSVNTISVTNIGNNEATVTASVTSDGGENVTQRGFVYDTLSNPTTSSMVAYHGTGVGQFSNLLSGLLSGKTYYVRAFATNGVGTAYGNEISFTTNVPSPVAGDAIPCPNTPTVTDHEGNVYNTVKIGTQCWTKENLRTTTSPSTGTYLIPPAGTEITHSGKQARWFDNDSATYAPKNCGLLYNWNAAMDTFNTMYGETSVNPNFYAGINVDVEFIGHRRGICPQGWHVPSSDEWTQLTDYLKSHEEYCKNGISDYIASSLASTTDWYMHDWEDCMYCPGHNPTDNNLSGFTAIPAGVIGGDQNEKDFSRITAFWSSNQFYWYGECALNLIVGVWDAAVIVTGPTKNSLLSVRCLRDESGNADTTIIPTDTTVTPDDTTTVTAGTPCPGTPTVTDYDGNVYNTVQIGEQCWMRENLRTTHYSDGTEIPIGTNPRNENGEIYRYIPGSDTTMISITGYNYTTRAAVRNSSSSDNIPSGTQGICPTGWHVPSPGEWNQLLNYVQNIPENICGSMDAKALADKEGWNVSTEECTPGYNQNDNNITGFSARSYNGDGVRFMTSSYYSSSMQVMQYIISPNRTKMWNAYSYVPPYVRCLRDESGNTDTTIVPTDTTVTPDDTTTVTAGIPCPGTPTVTDYDGNVYNTVKIGEQCWMRENLRTTHYADGTTISQGNGRYYPNGNADNVAFYGYLYTWAAVMHGENSSNTNPSGVTGICPAGWHVPSDAEWTQLEVYMIGQSQFKCGDDILYCAKSLADTIGWSNSNVNCAVGNNPTANNQTGFGARPAGRREIGSYGEFGTNADFWTSTIDNADNFYTWSRNIAYDRADIKLTNDAKSFGRSVRCLLNQTETPIQQDSVSDTSGDAQPCTGTPTVIDYDGNVYNTVQIGEQCWMKENLRTTHFADGVEIPAGNSASTTMAYRYNPNNSASNVSSYGYLYNWSAVMHGVNSSANNPSGVQGVCPTGWHVPSNAEWTKLTDYLCRHSIYVCGDNIGNVAKSLSATEGWSSSSNFCAVGNEQGSNNSTGFNARPAGYYTNTYTSNGNHFGRSAYFWTTTEINQSYAWHSRLGYVGNDVLKKYTSKHCGFSVRCLRD